MSTRSNAYPVIEPGTSQFTQTSSERPHKKQQRKRVSKRVITQYVSRWRVSSPSKKWTDPGPDLLRLRKGAVKQAQSLLPRLGLRVEVNRHDGAGWVRILRKDLPKEISERGPKDLTIAQVKLNGERVKRAVVRREKVVLKDLYNCSSDTILAHSLVEHQFPGIKFAGGYVYPDYQPGGWSDHAWGTAIDETANTSIGQTNDDVFNWVARMGQSGDLKYDYALGSRKGSVVQATSYSNYEVVPSGADSSHLWHVHISVVNHHGAAPPGPGGSG